MVLPRSGVDGGTIAGAVIGPVVVLLLVAIAVVVFMSRNLRKKKQLERIHLDIFAMSDYDHNCRYLYMYPWTSSILGLVEMHQLVCILYMRHQLPGSWIQTTKMQFLQQVLMWLTPIHIVSSTSLL